MTTFGNTISQARKKLGISQKELATQIVKEDGTAISPQYLNDIEHGRRNPPPEDLIKQFAKILGLSFDFLLVISRNFPNDINPHAISPEKAEKAMKAFRKALKE